MNFVFDFVNVGSADAIVVWIKHNNQDIILFIDGGKKENAKDVIQHFNYHIKPHVANPIIGIINSHPHADHINGLLEIVDHFKDQIGFAVYNDPVDFISPERKKEIMDHYADDPDITHLNEVFDKVSALNDLCKEHSIKRLNAFSDLNDSYAGLFKIISPSRQFYQDKVDYFTSVENLIREDFTKSVTTVDEENEGIIPCKVVDEKNDVSPENLTATVIEFQDDSGKKYLLTSDAGVAAFDAAEANGYSLTNYEFVQLPHHGSRRNVNSSWLVKFAAGFFVVSADGSPKHPRKAVISCIKKNTEANIFSTHKSGTLALATDPTVFPNRGWAPANAL